MTLWQIIGVFVLAVVIAVPAGLFVLYLLAGCAERHREMCPSCRQHRLRRVRTVRARVGIKREGTSTCWSYFLCEACGARFKQHLRDRPHGRGWDIPSSEEWDMFCAPDFPLNLLRKPGGSGPPDDAPQEPGPRG